MLPVGIGLAETRVARHNRTSKLETVDGVIYGKFLENACWRRLNKHENDLNWGALPPSPLLGGGLRPSHPPFSDIVFLIT